MTPGELAVWAAHWAQAWEAGINPAEAARLAAKAVQALRGAAPPEDAEAADMLRQVRGEAG